MTDGSLGTKNVWPREATPYFEPLGELGPRSARALTTAEVREIFKGIPGIVRDPNAFGRKKLNLGGEKKAFDVVYTPEQRALNVQLGRIRENVRPSELPPGKYTAVILEDGTPVFGLHTNSLEIGAKHLQLANGRKAVVGLELEISADGKVKWNDSSGSITAPQKEVGNLTDALIQERVGYYLEKDFGRGKVEYVSESLLFSSDQALQSQQARSIINNRPLRDANPALVEAVEKDYVGRQEKRREAPTVKAVVEVQDGAVALAPPPPKRAIPN
jgi:hypothetical protein